MGVLESALSTLKPQNPLKLVSISRYKQRVANPESCPLFSWNDLTRRAFLSSQYSITQNGPWCACSPCSYRRRSSSWKRESVQQSAHFTQNAQVFRKYRSWSSNKSSTNGTKRLQYAWQSGFVAHVHVSTGCRETEHSTTKTRGAKTILFHMLVSMDLLLMLTVARSQINGRLQLAERKFLLL